MVCLSDGPTQAAHEQGKQVWVYAGRYGGRFERALSAFHDAEAALLRGGDE